MIAVFCLRLERRIAAVVLPALIDRDRLRDFVRADSFVKKGCGCGPITVWRQQKVHRLPSAINGAIQIFPLAFYSDGGFIKPPALAH